MTWVRLDDNFHWHPKVAPLSDAAYRLYVGALCYCNRYDQGGRVTAAHVALLVGAGKRASRLVEELVLATLWVSEPPDWLIHDYFLYQPDPTKQRAGRAGGQASATARAQAEVKQPAGVLLKQVLKPRPVPSRPVGVKPPEVPLDEPVTIASRGWRGDEEAIGTVLQRFQHPKVAS